MLTRRQPNGKSQTRLYVLCGYILLFALGFITGGNQLILLDVANEFGLDNTGIGILAAMQYAAMIPPPCCSEA